MTVTSCSAETVKNLRDRTGAGMMDCKAALQACGNDIEKAIDFLRKKGLAQAAKRAGREAKEGILLIRVEGNKAGLVEANCETDFVAKTDEFIDLAKMALDEVFQKGDSGIQSQKVLDRVAELSGKIGEKMLVRRAKFVESKGGMLFNYLHSNRKLGVVIEIAASKVTDASAFEELGKNLAMQVAASNPICLTRNEVPAVLLEREKAVYREEIKDKPENIVDKIIQGKLEKFYQTVCLIDQVFIKDDKLSIKKLLTDAEKSVGGSLEIKQFVRMQLGESTA